MAVLIWSIQDIAYHVIGLHKITGISGQVKALFFGLLLNYQLARELHSCGAADTQCGEGVPHRGEAHPYHSILKHLILAVPVSKAISTGRVSDLRSFLACVPCIHAVLR